MKVKLRSRARPAAAARATTPAGAPRVAVVDDEPGNVTALVALLQTDYDVVGFTEPNEAFAYLSTHAVDVVLTDQRMPELRGTDLLMRLKELDRMPVSVIITGYTDVRDLVFCINEGLLYRYVLKPWVPDDVRGAVREGLRAARQAAAVDRLIPRQISRRLFPEGIERLQPGRTMQVCCAVMFADLRGFTSVAEKLSPEDTFLLLSQYFQMVEPLIAAHGGFVDKFLGDGVLAIFDGVDCSNPETLVERAQACGQAIEAAAGSFEAVLDEGARRLGGWRVGIGVASGEATLGTVGCPDRVEVTTFGETVVTASRLEEACKAVDATLLIQQALGEPTPANYRPLGLLPMSGTSKAVAVRQYVGARRDELATVASLASLAAVQAAGETGRAVELLRQLVLDHPQDHVLRRVLALWDEERSRQLALGQLATKESVS